MRYSIAKIKRISIVFLLISFVGFVNESKAAESEGEFSPKDMILHHVKDAYGMHIATLNFSNRDPLHITIPLPVIIYTDSGFTIFSSSLFHHDYHGYTIVEKDGMKLVNLHEKVYVLDQGSDCLSWMQKGTL